MQDPEPREPIWNRPFSKRQTKIAFFTVGWLAIFVIGDYETLTPN
jgi:hypothetical protein